MLGILLIDKPLGITSHDVVNTLRRKLGTKRVGHAGTLDPLGSGLLVVAVGPATRFLQYLPLEPKEYEGTITFGRSTTTYDAEGDIVSESPVPENLAQRLEELKPRFMGLIEQIPPMHSAVKVAGKPLYSYARRGQEVERTTRTIHISELDLTVKGADVDFRLVCSGGTYVRTLANDLGAAVGCGAFLSRLRRTKVGRFALEPSIHPSGVDGQESNHGGAVALEDVSAENLISLRGALAPMQVLDLNDRQTIAIREGQQVTVSESAQAGIVALADPQGQVFSVARLIGNLVQPECVIPSEAFDGSL